MAVTTSVAEGLRHLEDYFTKHIPHQISVHIHTEYGPPVPRGGPRPPSYCTTVTIVNLRKTFRATGGDIDAAARRIVASYNKWVTDSLPKK